MKTSIKVGVKYCGHCNPRLNGQEVLRAVQARIPDICFTAWDDPRKEILLIIDACPSGCATRPLFDGPVISLSGIPQQGEIEDNNRWATEQLLSLLHAVRKDSPDLKGLIST